MCTACLLLLLWHLCLENVAAQEKKKYTSSNFLHVNSISWKKVTMLVSTTVRAPQKNFGLFDLYPHCSHDDLLLLLFIWVILQLSRACVVYIVCYRVSEPKHDPPPPQPNNAGWVREFVELCMRGFCFKGGPPNEADGTLSAETQQHWTPLKKKWNDDRQCITW